MGFPEEAGKQKTECLGWSVGNIIKPTMPSNPVCLGICLVSMQTTLLQTPTKPKSVWTPLKWKFSKNTPKSMCSPRPAIPYWILSLASQASNILCTRQHFWNSWGKRENIQDFPENCGSSCSFPGCPSGAPSSALPLPSSSLVIAQRIPAEQQHLQHPQAGFLLQQQELKLCCIFQPPH